MRVSLSVNSIRSYIETLTFLWFPWTTLTLILNYPFCCGSIFFYSHHYFGGLYKNINCNSLFKYICNQSHFLRIILILNGKFPNHWHQKYCRHPSKWCWNSEILYYPIVSNIWLIDIIDHFYSSGTHQINEEITNSQLKPWLTFFEIANQTNWCLFVLFCFVFPLQNRKRTWGLDINNS